MSKSLPQRMREAADTIREADRRCHGRIEGWTPSDLEGTAEAWEAETELEVLEWRLANEFIEALPTKTGLNNGAFHDAARKLIAAGWTKQVTS